LIFMDGVTGAALAGVIAGAAVALPLGAIGVLLVQEAIAVGWWPTAAGAFGVGVVDLMYAAVAVLAGASVSRALAGHERGVQFVGAGLLIAVAVKGLAGLRRAALDVGPQAVAAALPPLRVAARFVTLTAVNPLTAIYFVALAAGSPQTVRSPLRAAAFLAGVFVSLELPAESPVPVSCEASPAVASSSDC
jgi:threonine/homoserine/homoserine lactone efflux protein